MNKATISLSLISTVLLISTGTFIALYSTEKNTNDTKTPDANCYSIETGWTISSSTNEYKNQRVPVEILLLNSSYTDEPFLSYNDLNLRPQIETQWVFSNFLPEGVKYINVEKFRGLGFVKVDGVLVFEFLNEFQQIGFELDQVVGENGVIIVKI